MMLKDWNEIKDDFLDCPILLGNGFSLNFSQTLNYSSLHSSFIEDSSPNARRLFDTYKTQNFEEVLKNLEITQKVNQVLGINNPKINDLQMEIRSGLVYAIGNMHPKPDRIDFEQTKYVSGQLKYFCDIFTTNYDLYLYYTVIQANKHFKDYYWGDSGEYFKKFMDSDETYKNHIYYLHGALFLFSDEYGSGNYKLLAGDDHLLNSIFNQISNNTNYPVFVSEGSSESKLNQIGSDPYLRFCYDSLRYLDRNKIVVYGHSLSEQDKHIVEAIDGFYKKVAIGLKPELFNSAGALRAEINKISQHFEKSELIFYNSTTLFSFHEVVNGFTTVYKSDK